MMILAVNVDHKEVGPAEQISRLSCGQCFNTSPRTVLVLLRHVGDVSPICPVPREKCRHVQCTSTT